MTVSLQRSLTCEIFATNKFQGRLKNGSHYQKKECIRWCKRHARSRQCANVCSPMTLGICVNDLGTTIDFGPSLTNTITKGPEHPQKGSQPSTQIITARITLVHHQGYSKSYPKFYDYLGTRFIWPCVQSCDVYWGSASCEGACF